MNEWLQANPIPHAAIILGLFWLLCKVIDKVWPIVWQQASNEGLVTTAQQKACQEHLAAELALIRKVLEDGDGTFANLRQGLSAVATTLRDLCRALPLDKDSVDCDRLLRWINGVGSGRGESGN